MSTAFAPSASLKVPAGQGVQSAAPSASAYVPAGQASQGSSAVADSTHTVPGVRVWRPGGQGAHAPPSESPPGCVPYVPPGHSVQRVEALPSA